MNSVRLGKLRALAADPAATDAERALAREHIARITGSAEYVASARGDEWIASDVPDELVMAMDQAMARLAGWGRSGRRDARVRAAQHRLGRKAYQSWLASRGPGLREGSR